MPDNTPFTTPAHDSLTVTDIAPKASELTDEASASIAGSLRRVTDTTTCWDTDGSLYVCDYYISAF